MIPENTIIVIFGGTGDLARSKLVPALVRCETQRIDSR